MPANRLGLEMRHLQALEAVARHRSFNAAAAELGYTQSAVSQQIVALEQAVGARVLERGSGPRPVEPTELGRLLLDHARAVLARVDAASVDVAALLQGELGQLRVGTYQSVATRLLPATLAAFRAEWPRIDVELFESGSHDEIEQGLERGELDLAFTTPPLAREDLFAYLGLLSDPYLLIVHPEHPLAAAGRIELGQLAQVDLVGYGVCRAHAQVERFMRARGIEPRVVMRAEDNRLLQGLAAQDVGAAIMPLLAVDLQRDDTVALDLSDQLPARRIGLAWHRERRRGPAADAFVRLSQEVSRELAEDFSGQPALEHA